MKCNLVACWNGLFEWFVLLVELLSKFIELAITTILIRTELFVCSVGRVSSKRALPTKARRSLPVYSSV